jgi:hypothetical protein
MKDEEAVYEVVIRDTSLLRGQPAFQAVLMDVGVAEEFSGVCHTKGDAIASLRDMLERQHEERMRAIEAAT